MAQKKSKLTRSKSSLELVELPEIDSAQTPFDKVPDEIIIKIFSYMEGFEISRLSQVSHRFYALANDSAYWKELCLQYWQDAEHEAQNTPMKTYYITRYRSFRMMTQEANIYRVLALLRTTILHYVFIFLLSAAVYLIGLKLDGYVNVPWVVVLVPFWIVSAGLAVVAACVIAFWCNRAPELRAALSRTFPVVLSRWANILILSMIFCAFLFPVLLTARLDAFRHTEKLSWWIVTTPLLYICIVVTVSPIKSLIKNGWSWSSFWIMFLVLSYDITICLSIAKLEKILDGDWCLLFLPWWISDVFALVCAVSLCMELRSARLGWCVTVIYTGYMASIITFRSLMCVNLGTVCGDPVAYSYNLIFISLQVFLFIFGLPLILFLRNRFAKNNGV